MSIAHGKNIPRVFSKLPQTSKKKTDNPVENGGEGGGVKLEQVLH